MTEEKGDERSDLIKFAIFGLCLIILPLVHGLHLAGIEKRFIRTEALILGKQEERSNKTSCTFYLLRFTDGAGREYEKRIKGYLGEMFEIGEYHPLLYDPQDPLETARSPRMMNRVAWIYGIVMALGFCCFIPVIKSRRRKSRPYKRAHLCF